MSLRNAVLAVVAAAAVVALALVGMRADPSTPDLAGRPGTGVADPPDAADPRAAATGNGSDAPLIRTPGVEGRAGPAYRLRGRVLDARGFAVQDARVFVDDARSRRTELALATASTDGNGRYELALLELSGDDFWLHVRHAAHPPFARHEAAPDAGDAHALEDVRLVDAGAILGRVTTVDGVPVPGATITPRSSVTPGLRLARDRLTLDPSIETRADGTFRLSPLGAGRYRLEVGAPRMEFLRSAATIELGEAEEVDAGTIVLDAAAELRGIVVDTTGEPLPGARIRVTARARGEPDFRATTHSDAEGRFAVNHVPLTTVEIVASLAGHLTWQGTRDATTPGDVWIRLDPGLVLAGTVVEAASGRPIESYAARPVRVRDLASDADLTLEEAERRTGAPPGDDPSTNPAFVSGLARRVPRGLDEPAAHPDGTFRFEGLDAGVYVVDVRAPGFAFARSELVELRPGAVGTNALVELVRGFRISGVVVDASTGEPVAGTRVDLTLPEGARGDENPFSRIQRLARPDGARLGAMILGTGTGGDGSFQFEDVAPGDYLIAARNENRLDTVVGPIRIASDTADVRIELSPGASIHGVVTNHVDADPEGARILAYGGVGRLRIAQVADDGSYEVLGLDAGPWVVRACVGNPIRYLSRTPELLRARDPSALPADVVLSADERVRLDLAIERPQVGDLVGEVTENGAPVHGARVWIPGLRTGRTDEDGRFWFHDVPAAPVDVRVGLPGTSGLFVQPTTVIPARESFVRFALETGALRARVVAAAAEPVDGSATFLPGAVTAPANLAEHARAGHPSHAMRVTDGVIDAKHLPAGRGLLIVRCGNASGIASLVIPRAGTAEIEVAVRSGTDR